MTALMEAKDNWTRAARYRLHRLGSRANKLNRLGSQVNKLNRPGWYENKLNKGGSIPSVAFPLYEAVKSFNVVRTRCMVKSHGCGHLDKPLPPKVFRTKLASDDHARRTCNMRHVPLNEHIQQLHPMDSEHKSAARMVYKRTEWPRSCRSLANSCALNACKCPGHSTLVNKSLNSMGVSRADSAASASCLESTDTLEIAQSRLLLLLLLLLELEDKPCVRAGPVHTTRRQSISEMSPGGPSVRNGPAKPLSILGGAIEMR